eukprot:scaffold313721_cov30-Tisochrysis_lutea.AAC.2
MELMSMTARSAMARRKRWAARSSAQRGEPIASTKSRATRSSSPGSEMMRSAVIWASAPPRDKPTSRSLFGREGS